MSSRSGADLGVAHLSHTSFVLRLTGNPGVRITARGNDSYAYIAADQVDQLVALFDFVPDHWQTLCGDAWRVVDAYPGMDALLERVGVAA